MSQKNLFGDEFLRNELPDEARVTKKRGGHPDEPRNRAYWEGFNAYRSKRLLPQLSAEDRQDPELVDLDAQRRHGYRFAQLADTSTTTFAKEQRADKERAAEQRRRGGWRV